MNAQNEDSNLQVQETGMEAIPPSKSTEEMNSARHSS